MLLGLLLELAHRWAGLPSPILCCPRKPPTPDGNNMGGIIWGSFGMALSVNPGCVRRPWMGIIWGDGRQQCSLEFDDPMEFIEETGAPKAVKSQERPHFSR